MKNDAISEILQKIKANPDIYKQGKRTSKFDLIFGDKKSVLINLVFSNGASIKKLYTAFIAEGILTNEKYNSFYKWIMAEKKIDKSDVNFIDLILPTMNDIKIDNISEKLYDSRHLFHGFDMNKQPDEETNPVPIHPEINHLKLCSCFALDHLLTNEKIVNILLYTIQRYGKNKFTNAWPHLLIKKDESLFDYYDRLQTLSENSKELSYEILDATSFMHQYAIASQYNGLKTIRRTRLFSDHH